MRRFEVAERVLDEQRALRLEPTPGHQTLIAFALRLGRKLGVFNVEDFLELAMKVQAFQNAPRVTAAAIGEDDASAREAFDQLA